MYAYSDFIHTCCCLGVLHLLGTNAKQQARERTAKEQAVRQSGPMDSILLNDYLPDSSMIGPVTKVAKARFKAIDVHSPIYARTPEETAAWVRTLDEVGIETTAILRGATGEHVRYAKARDTGCVSMASPQAVYSCHIFA